MRREDPRGPGARRAIAALSHPTRIRILDHLQLHDRASPAEMAEAFGMTVASVSYHARRLEALGYLRLVRRTQVRGAVAHHYAAAAVEDPERVVARVAGRFLAAPEANLSVRALLDATAVAELHADLTHLVRRARELETQTVARAGRGAGRSFPVHVVCVVEAGGPGGSGGSGGSGRG